GQNWTPITPPRGSNLHAETQNQRRISNEIEERRLKKTDPLTLAVVGGLIAAFSSVGVSLLNGRSQVALEREKHDAEMVTEAYKAEATRILEAIKLGDPDRSACTLKFMMKGGLIQTDTLRSYVDAYLEFRNGGSGVGTAVAEKQQPPSQGAQTAPNPAETPGCQPAPTIKAGNIGQPDTNTSKPVSDGGPLQVLSYATGWMGGGHNQNEACASAISQYQPQFPDKVLRRIASDEATKKDLLGHVEYRYFCTVGVFDGTGTK
ncbi:hypothetical protein ACDY97_36240, partial [Rhizobium mongolense]|uniref:hypothetical protein n=1 Tax=Rhizobium mongolense TaxID=57676 RepID=UPI003557FD1A